MFFFVLSPHISLSQLRLSIKKQVLINNNLKTEPFITLFRKIKIRHFPRKWGFTIRRSQCHGIISRIFLCIEIVAVSDHVIKFTIHRKYQLINHFTLLLTDLLQFSVIIWWIYKNIAENKAFLIRSNFSVTGLNDCVAVIVDQNLLKFRATLYVLKI